MSLKIILLFTIFFSNHLFSSETGESNRRDLNFKTKCDPSKENISISFVGDILIHKALYQSVVSETQHFDQIWKKTNNLIQKADFSVGNLEGPAALGIDQNGKAHGDVGFTYDDYIYSGTNFVFNYHPRILADLKNSGFDLLTCANNHAADRFSIGIDSTISAAKSINLPTVGIRKSNGTYSSRDEYYKIIKIKNMNIAFIGCTEFINSPDNDNQVLFCETDQIISTIKKLANQNDVDAVIVLPHWGVEYSPNPKDYQIEYAHKFLNAGASAVIGSHPHVLEPWEKYTTPDGRETLIIYSLGNFVAGQPGLDRQTGAIAYIGFSKSINQKASISGVAYTPTFRDGNHINPIGKDESVDVLNLVSSKYGTKARLEPGLGLYPFLCAKNL